MKPDEEAERYQRFLLSEIEATLEHFSELGSGCPKRLCEAMRYSLLGSGKRLRPLLTLLACEICSGDRCSLPFRLPDNERKDTAETCRQSREQSEMHNGWPYKKALSAAAAVEMIHAYSLIHDDLPAMDNDVLRRGRPTLHIAFDEATAILAGDALLTLAFEVLSGTITNVKTSLICCRLLARAAGARAMVGGQQDDISYPQGVTIPEFISEDRKKKILAEHLVYIQQRKTGALILAALKIGSTIAGADFQQIMALDEFGTAFSAAFQITDDILDAVADPAVLGKSVGKDQAEGRLTFVSFWGLERSRKFARSYVEQALDALHPFDRKSLAVRLLAQLTEQINRRVK